MSIRGEQAPFTGSLFPKGGYRCDGKLSLQPLTACNVVVCVLDQETVMHVSMINSY